MAAVTLGDIYRAREGVPADFAVQTQRLVDGNPDGDPGDDMENIVDTLIAYAAEFNNSQFEHFTLITTPASGALVPPTEDATLEEINRSFARAAGAAPGEALPLESYTREKLVEGIRAGKVSFDLARWAHFKKAARYVKNNLACKIPRHARTSIENWLSALIRTEQVRLPFVTYVASMVNVFTGAGVSVATSKIDITKLAITQMKALRDLLSERAEIADNLDEVAGTGQVRIGWC